MHSLRGLPHVIDIRNLGLIGGIELAASPGKPGRHARLRGVPQGLRERPAGARDRRHHRVVAAADHREEPHRPGVRDARRRPARDRLEHVGRSSSSGDRRQVLDPDVFRTGGKKIRPSGTHPDRALDATHLSESFRARKDSHGACSVRGSEDERDVCRRHRRAPAAYRPPMRCTDPRCAYSVYLRRASADLRSLRRRVCRAFDPVLVRTSVSAFPARPDKRPDRAPATVTSEPSGQFAARNRNARSPCGARAFLYRTDALRRAGRLLLRPRERGGDREDRTTCRS